MILVQLIRENVPISVIRPRRPTNLSKKTVPRKNVLLNLGSICFLQASFIKSPVTAPGKIELKKRPIQCVFKIAIKEYLSDPRDCKSIFHLKAPNVEEIEYKKKNKKAVVRCLLKKVEVSVKSSFPLFRSQKINNREKQLI